MAIVYKPEKVKGIEVLSCTDTFEFRPHIHDRYVVWMIMAGGEHYNVHGSSNILAPGSISIFEPGTVHANRPCTDSNRHLRSFYIETTFLEYVSRQVRDISTSNFCFSSEPLEDKVLWSQLAHLHELIIGDIPELELNTQVIQILGNFIDRHGHLNGNTRKIDLNDIRIDHVIESLHSGFDEPLSLETLADIAGCTQFHLIRLFKKAKGMTPHNYLTQIRLEKARRMLEKGESIITSALNCGFSDQSHLTRAFGLRYGLTPGSYRKSI